MKLTEDTKTLLFVAVCILLFWLITKKSNPIVNKGSLKVKGKEHYAEAANDEELAELQQEFGDEEADTGSENESEESAQSVPSEEVEEVEEQSEPAKKSSGVIPNKDYSIKGKKGKAVHSYRDGKRGQQGPQGWQKYFDDNNVIFEEEKGNSAFMPNDEGSAGFASYKSANKQNCGANQNCPVEDLFNSQNYLPKEANDEWFKTQKEPVSVKNRHLINVVKPVGINTVQTSLRNASRDFRGNPPCPKFVSSPWLNSSIEPDNNIRQLC
jgi:hypothetical protein